MSPTRAGPKLVDLLPCASPKPPPRSGLTDYYASFQIVDGEAQLGRMDEQDVMWLRGEGGLLSTERREPDRSRGEDRKATETTQRRTTWWAMIHKLLVAGPEAAPPASRALTRAGLAGIAALRGDTATALAGAPGYDVERLGNIRAGISRRD